MHAADKGLCEIVHGQPQAVIEELIHRLIQCLQGKLRILMGGGGFLHLGIHAHGLETHPRMLVANAGGGVQLRGGQAIMPMGQHAHGRGAHTGVVGLQREHQQRGVDHINRLMQPQGLHLSGFVFAMAREPLFEIRQDALPAFVQDASRLSLVVGVLS